METHIQNDDPEKALEVAASLDRNVDAVKVSSVIEICLFSLRLLMFTIGE